MRMVRSGGQAAPAQILRIIQVSGPGADGQMYCAIGTEVGVLVDKTSETMAAV